MLATALTGHPENGSVRLSITGIPAGVKSLVRRDANGLYPVRTVPGTLGTVPAAEPLVIDDYEAASGHVSYDVEGVDGARITVSLDWLLDAPWLFTPVMPGYSRRLERLDTITATREDNSTVHTGLLGRPDPVVVMRPHAPRSGTMTAWAGTYADAMDLLEALDQGVVFMLRQPDHARLDMYFHGAKATIAHNDPDGAATTWGITLDYLEVRRPVGDLAGALGWTYGDLLAAASSYADLPAMFATYTDLRLNVRTT